MLDQEVHARLTYILGKLQSSGYIERDDVDFIREVVEKHEKDVRLENALSVLKFVGGDRFVPTDMEYFIKNLDSYRYFVHRRIEFRRERYGSKIDISEDFDDMDLLAVLPKMCGEYWHSTLRAWKEDNTYRVECTYGGDYLKLSVVKGDDGVEVYVESNLLKREEVDIDFDYISESVKEYCQCRDIPSCIAVSSECSFNTYRSLGGYRVYFYDCRTNVPVDKVGLFRDLIRRYGGVVSCEDGRCSFSIVEDGFEDIIWNVWYDIADSYADRYFRELLDDYVEYACADLYTENEGTNLDIECDGTYAYPHGGGFMWYMKIKADGMYGKGLYEESRMYYDLRRLFGYVDW